MVTALRLIQIVVILAIVPMAVVGGMAGFSGGGGTPALQEIGAAMLINSFFVAIPAIIASEIVYRLMKHTRLPDIFVIPMIIAAIPIVMWVWYIIQLRSI